MTHAEIIDAWPSDRKDAYGKFAGDMGITRTKATAWRHRGSIPQPYWLKVVAKAKARRIKGVTLEALAA
jgi:hypothetical protein